MNRPLAIIPCFNEADILPAVLKHLRAQGIETFVVDNMSTDRSGRIAIELADRCITWKSPIHPDLYDWTGMLKFIAGLARRAIENGPRWIMLHDADEIRRAPAQYPGATLAEAFAIAEQGGWNAVQFHAMTFFPVDEDYAGDPEAHFQYHDLTHIDRRTAHIKAWLQGDEIVDLHTLGGHKAIFTGMKLCPVPFVLKHYPIRSTEQGRRKIYQERLPRFNREERAQNWHVQYRPYESAPPENAKFIRHAHTLTRLQPDCTILTLTRFPEIFLQFANSVEIWEPLRRRIVVTSGGATVERPGWESITGIEPFNFARNVNLGLDRIPTGNVLLVNDDVELTQPVIQVLQQILDDPRAGIITPQIRGGVGNPQVAVRDANFNYAWPYWETTEAAIPFICVLLRRELLADLGPLAETFEGYGGEDEEYNLRARSRGWKLAIARGAVARHGFGGSRSSSSFHRVMTPGEQHRSMERNRALARGQGYHPGENGPGPGESGPSR